MGEGRSRTAQLERENASQAALILSLQQTIAGLQAALNQQTKAFEAVVEKLEAMERRFLRPKTEKRTKVPPPAKDAARPDPAETKTKRAKNRESKREQAKTEETFHRVPDEQRCCPGCGPHELRPVGKGQTSEWYEYHPGYFIRYVDRLETLACSCGDYIVTAPPPPRPFENAKYGPRFIAHLLVAKCFDAIPLARQESMFKRLGIPMSRSTMCDLFHRAAAEFEPLVTTLFALIAAAPVVQADETSIKVKTSDKRGFIWTFLTDELVAFRFSPDRSGHTPQQVLGGTEGVLVVDGYTGYNKVVGVDGRLRAGCLAHARRKLFEAQEVAPEAVNEALDILQDVYTVEREAKKQGIAGTPEHLALRRANSAPAMDKLHDWLTEQQRLHPPRGKLGKAISYALNSWDALNVFLTDARVPVDNNRSEAALRRVALGRNNWLFVGHDQAGQNFAGLMSLIASCVVQGVNPEIYLADVLMRLGTHPRSEIEALLPHRWAPIETDAG